MWHQKSTMEMPFRCVLTLKPLIEFWTHTVAQSSQAAFCMVNAFQDRLSEAKELQQPIEDPEILNRHQDLLKTLMNAVFPRAFWEEEATAALVPFSFKPFFVSPLFQKLFLNKDGSIRGRYALDEDTFLRGRMIRAYLLILKKFYNIDQQFDYPVIRIINDAETGLERYFQMNFSLRFIEIHPLNKLKPLSAQERTMILENLSDPELMKQVLPPDNFEFRGFTAIHAMDVTTTQVISALERDLIDQDSMFSNTGFKRLQDRLQTLFRRPKLIAGIAAIHQDNVLFLNTGCEMDSDCIFSDSRHVPIKEFIGSIYHRALQQRKIIRIPDLLQEPNRTEVEEQILKEGLCSILVAPLFYRGECIGTMDLSSPKPGDLGPTDAMVMNQILPLFSVALKRAIDDVNKRLESIIKEKCTAVHPSVEWRFRKAAFRYLEVLRSGHAVEFEPIVFRDVYPLYAISDIRGSSNLRNLAIIEDLSEHLDSAKEVIRWAEEARSLPILQEISHRIGLHREKVHAGAGSPEELSVVEFLHKEVEPLFSHLRGFGPRVARAVEAYQAAVDPQKGTVYKRRKAFEESVSLLNERISSYLDREEARAQELIPHYFEKHQTDGVDYVIYLGKSLLERRGFLKLYLKNMRLWQLMVACGMAWHTERLKPSLKVPLETAHLILVNSSPMSIRFRFDEKHFDADGTYDIHQEILKARIDKAMVKERKERLTQPVKISIVYSLASEAREMLRYIEFLQYKGYLTGQVESLELEDLPGAKGLRALRVGVNLESAELSKMMEQES